MKFAELDSVVLLQDVRATPNGFAIGTPEGVIRTGAVGVVVDARTYPEESYLVEFSDSFGQTTAMPTLLPDQIRAATESDRRSN